MASIARRNLFHDRIRLAGTLTGIVFSVVLAAIQLGLFLGFQRATWDVIDRSGADLCQRAYVTAAAYGGRRFEGRVIRVGRILGRKNIRTDEPRERVDMKILEVLVELDEGASLPIGLRVDATLLTDATTPGRTPRG